MAYLILYVKVSGRSACCIQIHVPTILRSHFSQRLQVLIDDRGSVLQTGTQHYMAHLILYVNNSGRSACCIQIHVPTIPRSSFSQRLQVLIDDHGSFL